VTSVKPEYRTKACDLYGKEKNGFIDFYINDRTQWAIELLVRGRQLSEHRNRFDPVTGKYCTLPTKRYLVVDIRGDKAKGVVKAKSDLCVLYFSDDWTQCEVQMEHAAIKNICTQL